MRRVGNRLFDLTGCRGKTLWDWMSLLIVPLVIVAATAVLSYFESERESKRRTDAQEVENRRAAALRKADIERADALLEAENRRALAQQRIEDDSVKQTLLESYIRDISDLLLHEGLFIPKPSVPIGEQPPDSSDVSPVKQIARARTLTTVRQLDGARKALLLQFLYESNLIGASTEEEGFIITKVEPIINLIDADLSSADLSGANLSFANLSFANLSFANLSRANLLDANLSDANLSGADLRNADLIDADLSGADLVNADLFSANLFNAGLRRALLVGADLSGAGLSDAEGWTNEQLARAESLVGATMPDGTVMPEEAWEEFKKRYGQ
jgi:uncharacterized protein YjbI with pentapeptide repeats